MDIRLDSALSKVIVIVIEGTSSQELREKLVGWAIALPRGRNVSQKMASTTGTNLGTMVASPYHVT